MILFIFPSGVHKKTSGTDFVPSVGTTTVTMTQNEITTRTPVWSAFSDLYLDIPVTDAALRRIADLLSESPYSVTELERILFDEVHPVCRDNLRSVAGNWNGFNEPELVQAIVAQLERGKRFPWSDSTKAEIRELWTRLSTLLSP